MLLFHGVDNFAQSMHKIHDFPGMAENSDGNLVETVVICQGNLTDPDFHLRFNDIVKGLKNTLRTDEKLQVTKVEPHNSVRVTFQIPREAALRLRQLAQEGASTLRELGILSVQVEGDQVISLTLAGRFNEPQEIVLQTTSSDSIAGPSRADGTSNIVDHPIPQLLSQLNGGAFGVVGGNRNASSAETSQFRSPNVVAPGSEPIPFPTKSPTPARPSGNIGPFPFVSMTHAAQAMQTRESHAAGNTPPRFSFASSPSYPGPSSVVMAKSTPPPQHILQPNVVSQPVVVKSTPVIPPASQSANVQKVVLDRVTENPPPNVTLSSPLLVNLLQSDEISGSSSIPRMLPPNERKVKKSIPPRRNMMETGCGSPNMSSPSPPSSAPSTPSSDSQPFPSSAFNISLPNVPNLTLSPPLSDNTDKAIDHPMHYFQQRPQVPNHIVRQNFRSPFMRHAVPHQQQVTRTPVVNISQPVLSLSTGSVPPWLKAKCDESSSHPQVPTVSTVSLKPVTTTVKHERFTPSLTSTGKQRQFLINPLTGLLEPMSSESSSESDSDTNDLPNSPFRDTSNPPFSEEEVSNLSTLSRKETDQSDSETTVKSFASSDSRRMLQSKSRDSSPGICKEIVTPAVATSIPGEKITLRLKLEKSEPIMPAYKVDVSFVNMPSVKKVEKVSNGKSSVSSSTSCSSSQSNCLIPEPRVPPLHISLKGPNAAVVMGPSRKKEGSKKDREKDLFGESSGLSGAVESKRNKLLRTKLHGGDGLKSKKLSWTGRAKDSNRELDNSECYSVFNDIHDGNLRIKTTRLPGHSPKHKDSDSASTKVRLKDSDLNIGIVSSLSPSNQESKGLDGLVGVKTKKRDSKRHSPNLAREQQFLAGGGIVNSVKNVKLKDNDEYAFPSELKIKVPQQQKRRQSEVSRKSKLHKRLLNNDSQYKPDGEPSSKSDYLSRSLSSDGKKSDVHVPFAVEHREGLHARQSSKEGCSDISGLHGMQKISSSSSGAYESTTKRSSKAFESCVVDTDSLKLRIKEKEGPSEDVHTNQPINNLIHDNMLRYGQDKYPSKLESALRKDKSYTDRRIHPDPSLLTLISVGHVSLSRTMNMDKDEQWIRPNHCTITTEESKKVETSSSVLSRHKEQGSFESECGKLYPSYENCMSVVPYKADTHHHIATSLASIIGKNECGSSPSGTSREENGGAQGEDSGIESMDALSEKSPNQGESPCRKEDKEGDQYCDNKTVIGDNNRSSVPSSEQVTDKSVEKSDIVMDNAGKDVCGTILHVPEATQCVPVPSECEIRHDADSPLHSRSPVAIIEQDNKVEGMLHHYQQDSIPQHCRQENLQQCNPQQGTSQHCEQKSDTPDSCQLLPDALELCHQGQETQEQYHQLQNPPEQCHYQQNTPEQCQVQNTSERCQVQDTSERCQVQDKSEQCHHVPETSETRHEVQGISGVCHQVQDASAQCHKVHDTAEQYHHEHDTVDQCHLVQGVSDHCHLVQGVSDHCHQVKDTTEQCHQVQDATEQCHQVQVATEQCHQVQDATEQCHQVQDATEQCHQVMGTSEQCQKVQGTLLHSHKVQDTLQQCHKVQDASKVEDTLEQSHQVQDTSELNYQVQDISDNCHQVQDALEKCHHFQITLEQCQQVQDAAKQCHQLQDTRQCQQEQATLNSHKEQNSIIQCCKEQELALNYHQAPLVLCEDDEPVALTEETDNSGNCSTPLDGHEGNANPVSCMNYKSTEVQEEVVVILKQEVELIKEAIEASNADMVNPDEELGITKEQRSETPLSETIEDDEVTTENFEESETQQQQEKIQDEMSQEEERDRLKELNDEMLLMKELETTQLEHDQNPTEIESIENQPSLETFQQLAEQTEIPGISEEPLEAMQSPPDAIPQELLSKETLETLNCENTEQPPISTETVHTPSPIVSITPQLTPELSPKSDIEYKEYEGEPDRPCSVSSDCAAPPHLTKEDLSTSSFDKQSPSSPPELSISTQDIPETSVPIPVLMESAQNVLTSVPSPLHTSSLIAPVTFVAASQQSAVFAIQSTAGMGAQSTSLVLPGKKMLPVKLVTIPKSNQASPGNGPVTMTAIIPGSSNSVKVFVSPIKNEGMAVLVAKNVVVTNSSMQLELVKPNEDKSTEETFHAENDIGDHQVTSSQEISEVNSDSQVEVPLQIPSMQSPLSSPTLDDPQPFRIHPPLYTYSNPDKHRDSLSPAIDEERNSPFSEFTSGSKSISTVTESEETVENATDHVQDVKQSDVPMDHTYVARRSKEFEQLSIDIPTEAEAKSTRSTRASSRINSPNVSTTKATKASSIQEEDSYSNKGSPRLKLSPVPKIGNMRRKRQNSGSSATSSIREEQDDVLRRDNAISDIDCDTRPNKRKCSENAVELIKACMGVEDNPRKPSPVIRKEDGDKKSRMKRGTTSLVEESSDDEPLIGLRTKGNHTSSRNFLSEGKKIRGNSKEDDKLTTNNRLPHQQSKRESRPRTIENTTPPIIRDETPPRRSGRQVGICKSSGKEVCREKDVVTSTSSRVNRTNRVIMKEGIGDKEKVSSTTNIDKEANTRRKTRSSGPSEPDVPTKRRRLSKDAK